MTGKQKFLAASAIALTAGLAAPSVASAAVATGTGWEVSQTLAMGATPASVALIPAGSPTVTFSAPSNPLSFDSRSGGNDSAFYTLGSWLATGGASGITFTNGAAAGDSMDGTLFEFTGTVSVTSGETFTLAHDDGLTLIIGGVTVVSVPGPTPPTVTTATYTGATGNQPFTLVYGECCTSPAVLTVDLPLQSAIPEPSTWAMMVAGFAGLGLVAFRRSRKGDISVVST